jgi:hypothetical protein
MTPLLWDPPISVIQEIHRQARRAVASRGTKLSASLPTDADIMRHQSSLRQVLQEFNRRLIAADIMIEGLTWSDP